jgi:NADPH-dependent stearoyl-CoA 9-desaturase
MHLMTGNLSYQIEHHLFPDLPSNRCADLAPRLRALRPAVRERSAALAVRPGRGKIVRMSLPWAGGAARDAALARQCRSGAWPPPRPRNAGGRRGERTPV